MKSVFSQRIEQVREAFSEWEVDGLLVNKRVNCRWLSGFSGSTSALLVTADRAILATDSRYWEQAADQAPDFELFESRRTPQDTAVFLTSAGASNIGFEASYVTVQQAQELQRIEGVSWRPLSQPIEPMRMVKTKDEIAAIQAAAAITDAAMNRLPQMVSPGITEAELAWRLESQMRELGASGMAFPPIIAFGPNSARPHHTPGGRKLQEGEIVLVDMGARLNGYHSDMTRTFYFGETVDPLFQEIFSIVLGAQREALHNIKVGTSTTAAHLAAATVIDDAGYGENFSHGLGHGLGLEIHEMPFLSATRDPQIVPENATITIEPGIYLPGWGGVRIEDLALVTPDGSRTMSHSPIEPVLQAP